MRAVLDTNVLVSAVLSRGSPPDLILQAWRRGSFQLVTSAPLLFELDAVLRRPRIKDRLGWTDRELTAFVVALSENATVVEPQEELQIVATDEDDNQVVEAAIEGEADYIVSGDNDLLRLAAYGAVEVVTPARFVAILMALEP